MPLRTATKQVQQRLVSAVVIRLYLNVFSSSVAYSMLSGSSTQSVFLLHTLRNTKRVVNAVTTNTELLVRRNHSSKGLTFFASVSPFSSWHTQLC